MSKRSDHILLADVLEAVEVIQAYIVGLDYESFLTNRMVRDAVVRNIQVLGEAANRVSKSFREPAHNHRMGSYYTYPAHFST